MKKQERGLMTVLVVLAVARTLVNGQDEFMTCSRPVKSRAGRQVDLPCRGMDHERESWCNLPGPDYPWHAVRRFVFENQGLMRRMYGEVRQLSVLRMEFSGENNYIEDARNFDDLFKPVTVTTATPTILDNLVSTPSNAEAPAVSRSIDIAESEEVGVADAGGAGTGNEEKILVEEQEEQLTTQEFKTTTTEEPNSNISIESGGGSGDTMSTGEAALSTDELPTTTEESRVESNSTITSDEEKNRNEGQVLFQDFEKSSTTTTTTEEPRVRGNRPGVNACPVKEEVVAPYWANNTRGEILALLNLYPFEQYIHWEKCTNEHRQMYCRDGCRCEQQYRLHRLLAFDPHNECRGIFSDWFRFPSCCVYAFYPHLWNNLTCTCECMRQDPNTTQFDLKKLNRYNCPSQRSLENSRDKNNMDPQRFSGMYTTEQEVTGGASGGGGTRKRRLPSDCSSPNDGIYEELEKLRNLVEEVESERPGCSSFSRGTIDSSLMSTVFGIVLVMILSISVYAFMNLYKAIYKRYATPDD